MKITIDSFMHKCDEDHTDPDIKDFFNSCMFCPAKTRSYGQANSAKIPSEAGENWIFHD
jgi:hypothetical protein